MYFWNNFNRAWLQASIDRVDEIYAATTPLDRVNVIEMGSGQFADATALKTYMQEISDGSTEFWDLTGYGREVWLLINHNDWNFITSTQKFIP